MIENGKKEEGAERLHEYFLVKEDIKIIVSAEREMYDDRPGWASYYTDHVYNLHEGNVFECVEGAPNFDIDFMEKFSGAGVGDVIDCKPHVEDWKEKSVQITKKEFDIVNAKQELASLIEEKKVQGQLQEYEDAKVAMDESFETHKDEVLACCEKNGWRDSLYDNEYDYYLTLQKVASIDTEISPDFDKSFKIFDNMFDKAENLYHRENIVKDVDDKIKEAQNKIEDLSTDVDLQEQHESQRNSEIVWGKDLEGAEDFAKDLEVAQETSRDIDSADIPNNTPQERLGIKKEIKKAEKQKQAKVKDNRKQEIHVVKDASKDR